MKKILIQNIFIYFTLLGIANADKSFFNTAKDLFDNKRFDEAKFKFEQDIVYNPKNENSYLYLAKIYKIEKNNNLEESNLKTVILLNPENEEAVHDLTLLKLRKSDYEQSQKLIQNFKLICNKRCSESSKLQKKLDNLIKK
tara:strand:+ start:1220 stop:1642 length:423 start_codon:yes stop_codon:yes gene_type:complete